MKKFVKDFMFLVKIFLMLEYKGLTDPKQDFRNLM